MCWLQINMYVCMSICAAVKNVMVKRKKCSKAWLHLIKNSGESDCSNIYKMIISPATSWNIFLHNVGFTSGSAKYLKLYEMPHKCYYLPTEQIIYKKKWISCIIKKHQYHAWHIFLWQIKNQNENDTIISSVVNIDQEAVATANISSQATDSSV